jgi:hypothetical protein
MSLRLSQFLSFTALALTPAVALADGESLDIESKGELGTESRIFWPDEDERTDAGNVAMAGRLQLDAELENYSARARVFSRLDPYDRTRTRVVPEELYVQAEAEPFRLRVGFQMLNWTATEAFHPADIINSRILDGSFENPEKIGEPIASLRFEIPNGNVELLAMPVFTAPVLPSAQSPLNLGGEVPAPFEFNRGALIIDRHGKLTAERLQPQWGVQVQQTWGDADISVHMVQQIDRSQPLVQLDNINLEFRPVFQAVTQAGLTYQHVVDSTLLKLEGAYRVFDRPDSRVTRFGPVPARNHVLVAAGLEHATTLGEGSDTSFLIEGQVLVPTQDDYPEPLEPLFQHDVLIGMRHAFNDEQSTSVLATVIVDVEHPDQIVAGASLNRRLGEEWGATLGARFMHIPPEDEDAPVLFENLHAQHQLYLDIKRYF